MNATKLGLSVAILMAGTAFGQSKTFTGSIMDSECAKMGSHAAMEKEHNMKGAKACTLACVKNGAKYVLYDATAKKAYELDDQTKPQAFAGQKVKVTGTMDGNTIKVDKISR